jgi:hypothetical protein
MYSRLDDVVVWRMRYAFGIRNGVTVSQRARNTGLLVASGKCIKSSYLRLVYEVPTSRLQSIFCATYKSIIIFAFSLAKSEVRCFSPSISGPPKHWSS